MISMMYIARLTAKDGTNIDWIDPVKRIIIDNGFHQYEFNPEDVGFIEIEPQAHPTTSAAGE